MITRNDIEKCEDEQEVYYLIDGTVEDQDINQLPDQLKYYAYTVPAVRYILNGGLASFYYHCSEKEIENSMKGFEKLKLKEASDVLSEIHQVYISIKERQPNLTQKELSQELLDQSPSLQKLEHHFFDIIDYEKFEKYIGNYFKKYYKGNG